VKAEGYTAVNSSNNPLNRRSWLAPLYITVEYYGKFSMKNPYLSADFLNHPTEAIAVVFLWTFESLLKGNQIRQQRC